MTLYTKVLQIIQDLNQRIEQNQWRKVAEKSCSPKVGQDVMKLENFEGMLKMLENRINELEIEKLYSKSSNTPSRYMADTRRTDSPRPDSYL